jgi:hypothetical protein
MARRTYGRRGPAVAALGALSLLAAPAHAVDTLRTTGTVVTLDPGAVLADAADGNAVLHVAGRVYDLRLRPAPWRLDAAETTIDADGTRTTVTRGPNAAFVGTVAGDAASRVLLTVTPSGVDGFVNAGGRSLQLVPRRFTDRGAAVSDVTARDLPAGSLDPATLPGQQGMSAESIGNPAVLEWADSDFYNRYGSANWGPKMTALISRVDNDYWNAFGWQFNRLASLYACTNTSCDSSNGSTSTNADTLLYNWAVAMKARHDAGTDAFDMAYLYSGKNWDSTVNGDSMLPGRYSGGQFQDEGPYQGQSSDYEGSQVMAHEIGHTFSALHDDYSYYETETVFVCDLLIPVVNYCVTGHYETHYTSRQHFTIMCSSCEHQPPSTYWDASFTSWNRGQISGCHNGSWSSGTYTPSSGFSMAMGANC